MGEGEKAEPVPTKAKWRWLLDDVKPLLPTRKADVGSVDDSIKEVPNEHKAILEALSIGDDSDLDDSSDDNDTSTTASSPQKAAKRKRILELQQGWRAKRPALEVLGDLSPELQHQWETFYRSGLDRTTIKKLMTALVGSGEVYDGHGHRYDGDRESFRVPSRGASTSGATGVGHRA